MSRNLNLLVAFLVLCGSSFSVNISSCTNITSAGTYNLTANISGNPFSYYFGSYTTCVKISSSNVVLDCGFKSITATGNAAIEVEAPGSNVIIRNCVLNNGIGVDVLGMTGGRITNNSINPSYAGISGVLAFSGWNGSDILFNNITGGSYGIWEPGDGNLIGNNRLINQSSVGIIDGGTGNDHNANFVSGSGGDGMLLDGTNLNVHGNTVTNSAGVGVDFYGYDSNFTSNTVSNSGGYGIQAGGQGSGDYTPFLGRISSNSIHDNGDTGIEVRGAQNLTVSGNDVYNNAEGIHLQNSAGEGFHPALYNVFSGNNAHNNAGDGFSVSGVALNQFISNTGSNNGGRGMAIDSSDSILVDPSTFCNNTGGEGVLVSASTNVNVTDTVACNNAYHGIHYSNTNGSFVSGDTAYSNGGDGIALDNSASGNNVSLNTAYGNTGAFAPGTGSDGVYLSGNANNNFVSKNVVYNNVNTGLSVTASTNNTVINNTAYSQQSFYGFYINGGTANFFTNNLAYNNPGPGFVLNGATSNTLSGNTARNNSGAGFYLSSSPSSILTNNTAYNTPGDGVYVLNSNLTTLTSTHLYNNSQDLHLLGTGIVFNMTGTVFDNPAGNFQNYTNLSVNDTVNSEYGMEWSAQPAATPLAPGKYFSFAGKFVNITNYTTTSIDKLVWHWANSELSGYNEVKFELWKYNGTWSLQNGTPDIAGNQLSLSGLSSFSTFAVLQNNLTTNVTAVKLDQTAAQPSPGGLVRFNITISNTGDNFLNPVRVVDILPAGLTYSSASPAPSTVAGQTLTWNNLTNLSSGNFMVIYINATVNAGLVNSSVPSLTVTNSVSTNGTDRYGSNATSSSAANVTVLYTNVTLVKVDITPLPPSPGGLVQWRLNVSNPGQVTLNPVALTDTLPSGFTFSAAVPVPTSVVGPAISWANIGPIAPGASVLVYVNSTVDNSTANGTYTNNANVTGKPPNGSNVTAADSASVGVYAPAVNVVKSVTSVTYQVTQNATFLLNVTNTGAINVTLSIVDVLPPGELFQTATVPPTTVSNQTLIWTNIALLQPGQSFVTVYNATVNVPGPLTDNVTATGSPPNGNNVSDNSSATVDFIPLHTPESPPSSNEFSVEVSSTCSGNLVSVSNSGPVEGADVKVDGTPEGSTNSSGQAGFVGCGKTVLVRVSKSGFDDKTVEKALISCTQCVPECQNDTDCPSDKRCVQNKCVPIDCSCGKVQNHACAAYQCCSDSDCPSGQSCTDHACKPKLGCTSDAQCADNQACDIPPGAAGGACKDITGQCGAAKGHKFVPYGYECGTEPGCPSCPQGRYCVEHKCLSNDITCPSTAVVGDNKTCLLTENDKACGPGQNCTALVTTPDGKQYSVNPDENGNVQVPAPLSGKIKVTLLKDGKVVKEVFIDVLPKSAPSEPEKPTAAGPDMFSSLWLLVLLVIVVLGVVYWRSRGQKK
ncbi:MAG: right-handed parallel beta-helix repeat-containing protein [Candidatus Micrarchaeia archaeon]